MDTIRVTWEEAVVAGSFRSDRAENVPPELAPASDCSSSTYQSEDSLARLSADASNELQKDEDLTEWVAESAELDTPRQVQFKDVEIRSYPIIPGIHPDCTAGPPVSELKVYRDSSQYV